MPSYKRFRLFWHQGKFARQVQYHAAHIGKPGETLCGGRAGEMETDGKEYQLPPPKVNCFRCLKEIKRYWPEKGSYYMSELR